MTSTFLDRTLGNYKILSRLGEGGMGTVFLARVLKSRKGLKAGSEVAVKVLHSHFVENEDILRRFKREAGLGLKLRHRRVMATFDVGSEKVGGVPVHFIVMEVLRGRTLRQVLDESGPLPEDKAVSVAREIAEGLAAIHDMGAVHRDIKPSNVFVDDAGHAKIADLGLSRLLEPKTEISLPGTFLGSVAYAAPEQLEGDAVGPATDLYGLGVLLYELVTGNNPFAAADLRATMHAHSTLLPPPPSHAAPQTSYFLDRLVLSLLEKDPARRLQPARKVAGILEQREQSEWWRQVVSGEGGAARLTGARRQLKVVRASRLHGRDRELEVLEDALRTAAVGRTGRVVLITGEAGGGKSRLIDAALEAAESGAYPFQAAVSRFLDVATPLPYYPLSEALLLAFDLKDLPRDERRQKLPGLLSAHLPERRVFADAFAALIDDKDATSALAQLPRDAIPALYAEAFRTLSARRALFLVLEELQWADPGSLRVLELLAGSIDSFPLALIVTARAEDLAAEDEDANARRGLLASWSSSAAFARIDLQRLDRAAVVGIVRDLGVHKRAEKALTDRLFGASEGNPAFLFALLDDLEQRGKLREPTAAELRSLPIPATIADLFARRLDDIDPEARRLLEFASVFGPRFKLEPVVEGLGLSLVDASRIAARLTDRYRVIRVFDQAYRFDHHLLHERVYQSLPAERRRDYHARVARLLAREVFDPLEPGRAAYEAGVHFSLADEHSEAARHLVGAARYLAERNEYERAERLIAKAVVHAEVLDRSGAPLPEGVRFALFETRAQISGHLGRREEQAQALLVASRAAHGSGEAHLVAEAEVHLARFAATTARPLAALQHVEQAHLAALRAGDAGLQAGALRVKADVLRMLGGGSDGEAERLLQEADTLARSVGDEQGRAFGRLLLGQLQLATDQPTAALETLKDALRLFEELDDDRGRGRAFFHIGRAYREFADLERAAKAVEVAERVAVARNDLVLQPRCHYLRGDLAMRDGAYSEADDLLGRAVEELRGDEDPAYEVYALNARALLYTASGFALRDPERAEAFAREAIERARGLGLARQEAYSFTVLAFAYLAAGKPEFALAVSRKGVRFAEQERPGKKRAAEIFFLHYRCLKRLRRRDEALPFLRRALALVEERGAEIEDEERRARFLEHDRFNAAVRREARAVLGR